jgi:hypothetical protein
MTLDYLSGMHAELEQADAKILSLMNEIYPYTAPFAPSISHFLNFKLPIE